MMLVWRRLVHPRPQRIQLQCRVTTLAKSVTDSRIFVVCTVLTEPAIFPTSEKKMSGFSREDTER